jgi:hypothetical protein
VAETTSLPLVPELSKSRRNSGESVKGLQIAKTKLSVRKAEKRHGKEGQEGRKEAT